MLANFPRCALDRLVYYFVCVHAYITDSPRCIMVEAALPVRSLREKVNVNSNGI